ncbi:MAG: porin family protein [Acidobacteriota bacterium]|nr:porin family protein [Acidobacteriota bacterium]
MPWSVRYVRPFLAVLAICVAPWPAAAQATTEPKTVTITPFLGSVFGTSEDLGGSLGLGVAMTYDLTSRLGVEGELAHAFDVLGDDANVDLSVTNVSGNAVYNFPVPRVTPYATFGIGIERTSLDVKSPDPLALYAPGSTEVSYNFGGGVRYPVSELFVARADVRRFQANDLAPDYWRVYGGLTWWIKR